MIVVTGGAGFIGSVCHAALRGRGERTLVVDRLGSEGKWRNLRNHPPGEILSLDRPDLAAIERDISAVIHLGAISETTATDGDLTWETNVALSQRYWHFCARKGIPFLYASSAATYGDGAEGFEDDPAALRKLRPLNLYGWTKHAFDLWVMDQVAAGAPAPPFWAGLKFFNVYGPNEYHKGGMISVVHVKHRELATGGPAKLFRSDRAGLADGAQARDFIWVGDVVDVILWLLEARPASGLYNLGTGVARTYLDLARAVADAMGVARAVEFVDMPGALAGKYQSFTQAAMGRLRAAGYAGQFTSLEAGVTRYVRDYLMAADPYL